MIETEDSLEILEVPGQAEGESGSETIGFSTFGAQRINDAQKRRARPTSVSVLWNKTNNPAQAAVPTLPQYWGTFLTTFDGTILAGARNDGLGSTTAPWDQSGVNQRFSDGAGGNVGLTTTSYIVLGRPAIVGFDIFIDLLQTDVDVTLTYFNPYVGVTFSQSIVTNKIPQIGQYTMVNQPASVPPYLIIRRRPEGYLGNEDGAQIFLTLPYAATPTPAGFINPVAVGVPVFAGLTTILTNIIP